MTTKKINCPKCDGKGYIAGLSHYANGVCFCCNGAKTVTVNITNLQSKLSADCRKKAEWIMASTEASYANLSYTKLAAIRDFAHGGWGLQEAYPEMRNHYFEVGEAAFQSAQNEKLARYYATC
jgi:hypothetical protein